MVQFKTKLNKTNQTLHFQHKYERILSRMLCAGSLSLFLNNQSSSRTKKNMKISFAPTNKHSIVDCIGTSKKNSTTILTCDSVIFCFYFIFVFFFLFDFGKILNEGRLRVSQIRRKTERIRESMSIEVDKTEYRFSNVYNV